MVFFTTKYGNVIRKEVFKIGGILSSIYLGCAVFAEGDITFTVTPNDRVKFTLDELRKRPVVTEKKSVIGSASGGRFGSANGILANNKFPSDKISGEYSLEPTATTYGFKSAGTFLPNGDTSGSPLFWSFEFLGKLLFIDPKEATISIGDTIEFVCQGIGTIEVTGGNYMKSGSSITFQDVADYIVSAKNGSLNDNAVISVTPKIVNFQAKNNLEIWPKASGQSITKDDFDINFEPTDATWIHSAPSGTPDLEFGKIQSYTAKAIVTKNGKTVEAECKYQVMGPGEVWDAWPAPVVVDGSFKDKDVVVSVTGTGVYVYNHEKRSGAVHGKGTFVEKDSTGWSVRGGSLAQAKSEGYSITAQVGVTWRYITGAIGFEYSSVDEITFGHSGISAFSICQKGLRQTVPTKTSGIVTAVRTTSILYDGEWQEVSRSFEENNIGSGNPNMILGKKFP